MADIEIRPFAVDDADAVLSVILPIQREEFGIAITADDQPDLAAIPDFYQSGKGQFWVAVRNGQIVGTIGLKDIGNSQTALPRISATATSESKRSHKLSTTATAASPAITPIPSAFESG